MLLALSVILFSSPFKHLNEIFLSVISIIILIFAKNTRKITKYNFKFLLLFFFMQSLIFLHYFLKLSG